MVKPYFKKIPQTYETKFRQNILLLRKFLFIKKVSTLLEKSTFYHERAIAIVSERYKAMEIDDPLDLIFS